MTEEDCKTMYDKWYLNDKPYITKEESSDWLNNKIAGNITKYKLDMQRNDEINDCDLLMNTSIVYHTESIIEM